MSRDLLNMALRSFKLVARPEVGLGLIGNIDEVRRASTRFARLPIRGIEIIGHQTPRNPSCAFLENTTKLQFVRLFAGLLTDIERISALKTLQSLAIEHVAKNQRIALDLGSLPALRVLNVEWFEGADSAFQTPSIESLNLMYCPNSSSAPVARLPILKRLRIAASGLTEINGIANMPTLEWIALLALNKLEDFSGLTNHPSLRFAWIEGCRKLRLQWLEGMKSIETLRILESGNIEGLEVLRSLPTLRHLHLVSDRTITEDISFLRSMANLESVFIKDMPDREAEYWRRRNKSYDLLRTDVTRTRSAWH